MKRITALLALALGIGIAVPVAVSSPFALAAPAAASPLFTCPHTGGPHDVCWWQNDNLTGAVIYGDVPSVYEYDTVIDVPNPGGAGNAESVRNYSQNAALWVYDKAANTAGCIDAGNKNSLGDPGEYGYFELVPDSNCGGTDPF